MSEQIPAKEKLFCRNWFVADCRAFVAMEGGRSPTGIATNARRRKIHAAIAMAGSSNKNDEWQLQHRYMSMETMTGLAEQAPPIPKIEAGRGPATAPEFPPSWRT
ncbi:hypothetical protein [uncultured Rhodoblastus sp.]|uniref:hypothetical protein n=1 Tax=uncultured Rhodoblastus sp. TaxID=543037 RepID=UPI0025F4B09E|nr:hypothetical protein [uncultured Rhodoblastus sp.]